MCCNSETVPVQMAIFFHVYLKTCGLPFTLFWFILRKENLRMAAIEIYFKNRNKVSASLPFKNSLYPVLCLLNPCLSVWHPFITRPSGLPVFSIFFMFWHLWPHQWKRLPANSWKQQRARLEAGLSYVKKPILSPYLQSTPLSNTHAPSQYSPYSKSTQDHITNNQEQLLCPKAYQNSSNQPVLSC